ncbi:hypothetical protein OJ998_04905 [Solirubrobacter taibaiensis]|nr:hypothetical protein [Solirubrobacter taibaiensis]
MNDDWLRKLEVFCADIGSIAGGKFAWARRHATSDEEEVHAPSSIAALAGAVIFQLEHERPTALGVEMPLFVPVPEDFQRLGKARPTDHMRPAWSQSTGASVMATGLVQLAWLLDRVRQTCPLTAVHLSWQDFCAARSGLLIWEAFVSGPDKDPDKSHEADARIGLEAFCARLPDDPTDSRAADVERPLSLAAAAALWAGFGVPEEGLRAPTVLVRP